MQASTEDSSASGEAAQADGHAPDELGERPAGLRLQRAELARAIDYWGRNGDGGEPGICLTRQASALVTVLANMDFAREREVMLPAGGRLAELVRRAQVPA
jgi:hypothetical protein